MGGTNVRCMLFLKVAELGHLTCLWFVHPSVCAAWNCHPYKSPGILKWKQFGGNSVYVQLLNDVDHFLRHHIKNDTLLDEAVSEFRRSVLTSCVGCQIDRF